MPIQLRPFLLSVGLCLSLLRVLKITIKGELMNMKVLVIGANGQIGKHLVQLLKESDEHTVRAMVRTEEQVAYFEDTGVETRLADLEGSVNDIAKAAEDCDAIIFAAGSGAHTGADKTILIDLDGAAKSIEAAEMVGINRFIMVSVIRSEEHTSELQSRGHLVC